VTPVFFSEMSRLTTDCRTEGVADLKGPLAFSHRVTLHLHLTMEMLSRERNFRKALREAAAACHLSRAHLSRTFKRCTGLTPQTWHRRQALERAARLLIEAPEHSLAEIAQICGFSDQSHFSNAFRRVHRESPAAWRRRMRSEGNDGSTRRP